MKIRMRRSLAGAALVTALAGGTMAVPAQAAEARQTQAVEASSAGEFGPARASGWYYTGETFNRFDPCDTRGQWYWDTYYNVLDWDCRWNSANQNYRLHVYAF